MPRRANGEGSIRQLKNGSWEARIMCGRNPNGKPKIKTFTGKKRAAVARRLADFIAGARQTAVCRDTLGQWLDTWLEEYVARQLKTSTRTSYENTVRNQIRPRLGAIRLKDLKKSDVEAFYASLLEDGRADGTGGLSAKSVRNVHIVLHCALEQAFRREYIDKNPAGAASIPGRGGADGMIRRPEALTLAEQRALTAQCGMDACGMAVVTALGTGLRIGELLGLRWADIDFGARTVTVRRQLSRLRDYEPGAEARTRLSLEAGAKTRAGLRVIPLDEALCARLAVWQTRQAKQSRQSRRPDPDRNAPDDMVFMGPGGGYLDPATFRYRYRRLLKQAGTRPLTVHALRHTFATRALEAGVPAQAVGQILGHAGSQITLDVYSHVLPAFQAEAVTRIARYVGAGSLQCAW